MNNNFALSVVIITYNKLNYLKTVLKNLNNQTKLRNVEFVVVNDGSTDGTKEFLDRLETKFHLKKINIPNSGSAVARNTGIRNSTGDNILFIDDDILMEPLYISKLLKSLAKYPDRVHAGNIRLIPLDKVPDVMELMDSGIVVGNRTLSKISYTDAIYGTLQVAYRNNNNAEISCWWGLVTGGNICFPRAVIEDVGYFDDSFKNWGPEDIDLTYRAFKKNFKLKFNSIANLYHMDHSRNPMEIKEAMARNVSLLLKKYHKSTDILSYINFFNGMTSLNGFNSVCLQMLPNAPKVELEEYYISLDYYLEKGQMINWKKNESN
jgi:glycosyltransferase involved in cell wall biosynthesis